MAISTESVVGDMGEGETYPPSMIPNAFAGDTTHAHSPNSSASAAGSSFASFTAKRAATSAGTSSAASAERHAAQSEGAVTLVRGCVRGGGAMSTKAGMTEGSGVGSGLGGREVGSCSRESVVDGAADIVYQFLTMQQQRVSKRRRRRVGIDARDLNVASLRSCLCKRDEYLDLLGGNHNTYFSEMFELQEGLMLC